MRHPDGQFDVPRVISKHDFESAALPHAPALYRTAYYLTTNAFDAEDLTQETYLRAYRGIDGFRGGDFRAWLFAILRHAFIDECRRRGRSPIVDGDIDDIGLNSFAASAPSAEAEALDGLPSEQVARAFAALPEEWRMIVLLADVEDFSYREIAQAMDIPVGTVMSRLHRARKRLHDLMLDSQRADGR
jgi:RNA polymerase sigma-70 factor, ECF subfamily